MLRSLKEVTGYTLQETDDVIGTCKDFLFDDSLWVIRYMVADTGNWLNQHKVLISPASLGEPDWQTERLPVQLTREQIEACPPLDTHAPLSREYEISYHEHFEIPFYWMGADFREGIPDSAGAVSAVDDPPEILEEKNTTNKDDLENKLKEGDLRSAIEIMDYSVSAKGDNAGRIDDIIVDDDNWVIDSIAVETGHIMPERKVLVNSEWVEAVNWETQQLMIDLTRDALLECPPFDPNDPVNRQYEVRLYDYHGRPRDWGKKQFA